MINKILNGFLPIVFREYRNSVKNFPLDEIEAS